MDSIPIAPTKEVVQQRLGQMAVNSMGSKIFSDVKELVVKKRSVKTCLFEVCYKIAEHWFFQTFISLCIIANTVVLGMDKYPITDEEIFFLENMNLGLTIVFVLEMIIKLIGLGPKSYFKDSFNSFDCIIVCVSIIDFSLTYF